MGGRRLPITKLLPWVLLIFVRCVSSSSYLQVPRLSMFMRTTKEEKGREFEANVSSDFNTYFYTQTLDHFNYRPESYNTFQQKYVVNYRYWGGPNTSSPILVYMGAESRLTAFTSVHRDFMVDNAPHFKALLVYIEHRYYGDSIPFGSMEVAYQNSSTLGYLSSTQALADYAEIIIDLKRNLSAENCPVIVLGGSYGGMLASWFRLKYPHIAMGALASSAPILYFDDITPQNGYYTVVTKDFREASESCYTTIRESWFEIDKIAAGPDGLTILSQKFNTCEPLNSSKDLKYYIEFQYLIAAQYDRPPEYPVNMICNAIDGLPEGSDILSRIYAGLNVIGTGYSSCTSIYDYLYDLRPNKMSGWDWQKCSEMVFPIGRGENDTMFQAAPFDMNNYSKQCQDLFGITPRPHWITTEFGGHNIKSVLKKFASNIIFSNGLRDPYSIGGVLQNISDSVLAIYTNQGSHCIDIIYPSAPSDPEWLVLQRNIEVKIIDGWIADYNATLINKRI